jgi:hypothetical protein
MHGGTPACFSAKPEIISLAPSLAVKGSPLCVTWRTSRPGARSGSPATNRVRAKHAEPAKTARPGKSIYAEGRFSQPTFVHSLAPGLGNQSQALFRSRSSPDWPVGGIVATRASATRCPAGVNRTPTLSGNLRKPPTE